MTQDRPPVKEHPQGYREDSRTLVRRCRDWIDGHPRTGWYIAVLVTLNFLLNLIQTIH